MSGRRRAQIIRRNIESLAEAAHCDADIGEIALRVFDHLGSENDNIARLEVKNLIRSAIPIRHAPSPCGFGGRNLDDFICQINVL